MTDTTTDQDTLPGYEITALDTFGPAALTGGQLRRWIRDTPLEIAGWTPHSVLVWTQEEADEIAVLLGAKEIVQRVEVRPFTPPRNMKGVHLIERPSPPETPEQLRERLDRLSAENAEMLSIVKAVAADGTIEEASEWVRRARAFLAKKAE
jgi:hypothetical protein